MRYVLTVTGEPGSVESADERSMIQAAYAAVERCRARGYDMGVVRTDRAFASSGLVLAQGFKGPSVSGGDLATVRLVRVKGEGVSR